MLGKIVNFGAIPDATAFQLICSECCNPLPIRWDRSGLVFVDACECISRRVKGEVEDEIRAELEDDHNEEIESLEREIRELSSQLSEFTADIEASNPLDTEP